MVASSNGATTWGDYSSTRRHGASGNTWVATGQYKPSASAVRTYYVWFGRERDQPPFNDYFPNALTVSTGTAAFGSNVNATKEEGEPNHCSCRRTLGLVAIYTSSSGLVTITTAGSSYDTLLAVYSGSSGQRLTKLAENDDCIGVQSCVTFFAVAGTTYRIAVDGFSALSGNIQLNVWRVGYHAHDFNANGRSDVAWRHSSGATAIWLMNGVSIALIFSSSRCRSPGQSLDSATSTGDGNADWLWRDATTAQVAIWLLCGAASTVHGAVSGTVPLTWSIVGTGDFNGDGNGDMLWRDTTRQHGNLALERSARSLLASLGDVPTNWIDRRHRRFQWRRQEPTFSGVTAAARW